MVGITESWRLIWYKNLHKVMCITEVIPGNVDMLFFRIERKWGIRPFADRTLSARDQQKGVYGWYTGYTAVRLIARTVRAVTKGRIGIAYNTGGYESLAVTRESMELTWTAIWVFVIGCFSQINWNYKVQKPYQCHVKLYL